LAPEIHHRLRAVTIGIPKLDASETVPAGALIEIDGDAVGEAAYDFKPGQDDKLLVFRYKGERESGQALFADGLLVGEQIKVDAGDVPLLPELFGGMSVDLFQHGAENLRAGSATKLDGDSAKPWLESRIGEAAYQHFKALDLLTLIGGGLNGLWHRDGIDRMADWLSRSPEMRGRYRKKVLLDYGHQDLYWGRNAAVDVFPKIIAGLGPTPPEGRSAKDGRDEDEAQEEQTQAVQAS